MPSPFGLAVLSCCVVAFDASADSAVTSPCPAPPAPVVDSTAVSQTVAPDTSEPRFDIRVGPFVAQRGMRFSNDPESRNAPPEYPGQTLRGISAHAGLFSAHDARTDRFAGFGVTFDGALSVGSTFDAMDDTGYGAYSIEYTSLEGAVHYRVPVDRFTFDASVSVGRTSYQIVDLPESIQVPDTAYGYVGAGAQAEAHVARDIRLGARASYQQLTSGGDIMHEDWYGAGTGHGVTLAAEATLPLSRGLYLQAGIEHRRFKIDFTGSGMLSEQWGVWDVTDTTLAGSAQLGATF